MLKLIKKLLEKWACKHQWEKILERDVKVRGEYGSYEKYTSITYCCKNCGKFKRWESS